MPLTTPPSCTSGNPACTGDECSETYDAKCAIYTGDAIANLGILKGDSVSDVIQKLATWIVNPGCASPAGSCQAVTGFYSTTIAANYINLKWNLVTTATKYQVEYRKTTVGTWILNPERASTVSTDIISGLEANTDYYVRINTTCSSGNCYSITLQIKTLAS